MLEPGNLESRVLSEALCHLSVSYHKDYVAAQPFGHHVELHLTPSMLCDHIVQLAAAYKAQVHHIVSFRALGQYLLSALF